MSSKSLYNKFFVGGAMVLALSRCVAAPSGAYGPDYAPYSGGYYGGPLIGDGWGWGGHGEEGHEEHGEGGHEERGEEGHEEHGEGGHEERGEEGHEEHGEEGHEGHGEEGHEDHGGEWD